MTKITPQLDSGTCGPGELPNRYMPAALHGMWAAMSEDARLAIFVLDCKCRVLALNAKAASLFGMDSAHAIGREIYDLYPASLASDLRVQFENLLSRGESCENRDPMLSTHLLGGYRWCCSMRLLDLREGQPSAVEIPAPSEPEKEPSNYGILRVCRVANDPEHLENLIKRFSNGEDRETMLGPLSVLTDRELEVAMLIATGLTDAAIAKHLYRSLRTVHAHRRAIGSKLRKKLGVQNRCDLIRIMTERGMVAKVDN